MKRFLALFSVLLFLSSAYAYACDGKSDKKVDTEQPPASDQQI